MVASLYREPRDRRRPRDGRLPDRQGDARAPRAGRGRSSGRRSSRDLIDEIARPRRADRPRRRRGRPRRSRPPACSGPARSSWPPGRPGEPRRRPDGPRPEPARPDRPAPVRRVARREGPRLVRHAGDLDGHGRRPPRSSPPPPGGRSTRSSELAGKQRPPDRPDRSTPPAPSSAAPSARSRPTARSTSSCTRAPAGANVNPDHDVVFRPGDTVLIIAPMPHLLEIQDLNQDGARLGTEEGG